jgi:hypothetical protein
MSGSVGDGHSARDDERELPINFLGISSTGRRNNGRSMCVMVALFIASF